MPVATARAPSPAPPSTAAAKPAAPVAPALARMSAPAAQFPLLNIGPPAIRLGTSASTSAPSNVPGLSGGEPLSSTTQNAVEGSLGVNLQSVRVHTDTTARNAVGSVSARAFTYGEHIFLGPGERPTDLGLMAHEATHVVQQQGAPILQRSAPGQSDIYEHEAQRSAAAVLHRQPFTVHERTSGPRVQRLFDLSLPDPLNWLANKANIIPGFRMFTIILGVNPINMSPVARSAANILRALIEFLPGGGLITQALDNSGVFEKAGAFVEAQIATLGMTGSAIKAAVTAFIKGLSLTRILTDPGGVWESAKRIFTDPIDRIKSFGVGLVTGIIELIKDAILKPIAKLAEGTEGYNLLKGILGKDPITGEAVTPSAETLLGPLMKMIGLGDIWEKMQQANAIPRCWQWFQSTKAQLFAIVSQIPPSFIAAFKSLTLEDIILVPKAFIKLGKVFVGFLGKFVDWGLTAMWNLLEIVFDVVSPGAFGYVKKTGAALKSILKNPLPFVGNLAKAAMAGFKNFAGNILTHLKKGLIDWLTGSLEGVYIPTALTLIEFGKLALSVLGISWAQIRAKIVKALGPTGEMIMKGLEAAFDVVKALVTGGPAAAWEVLKDKLTDLKDQIVSGIISFVTEAIVTKAVPKLIAMFIPGAGFISAIISIYDMVMVFVEKIKKIIQVVTAFINSIVEIAAGNIGAAAAKVESILGGLMSLAISFLAGFVGLGKVASKVRDVITKIRAVVDKALDTAINFIIGKAKALFAKLFGKKDKEDDKGDFREKAKADLASKFKGKLKRDKIQGILSGVFSKYQKDGLKGVVAKPKEGSKDQYEAVLIASTILVSNAEADLELDTHDLDLGWGRTVATAILKAGSKTHPFGSQMNDGTLHAEEKLIKVMNKQFPDVAANKPEKNLLTISITRSPCGDAPKAHNCGLKIQEFIGDWSGKYNLQVTVRAASIYGGKFRKASKAAIQALVKSGVAFTHWDIINELGEHIGDIPKDVFEKLKDRVERTKVDIPAVIAAGSSG